MVKAPGFPCHRPINLWMHIKEPDLCGNKSVKLKHKKVTVNGYQAIRLSFALKAIVTSLLGHGQMEVQEIGSGEYQFLFVHQS